MIFKDEKDVRILRRVLSLFLAMILTLTMVLSPVLSIVAEAKETSTEEISTVDLLEKDDNDEEILLDVSPSFSVLSLATWNWANIIGTEYSPLENTNYEASVRFRFEASTSGVISGLSASHIAQFVSLEGSSFSSGGSFNGGVIPESWLSITGGRNFEITIPVGILNPSTVYKVVISKDFTDKNGDTGNGGEDFILQFTTKAAPIPPNEATWKWSLRDYAGNSPATDTNYQEVVTFAFTTGLGGTIGNSFSKTNIAKYVTLEGASYGSSSSYNGGIIPEIWITQTAGQYFVVSIPIGTLNASTTYNIRISKDFLDANGYTGNGGIDYLFPFTTKAAPITIASWTWGISTAQSSPQENTDYENKVFFRFEASVNQILLGLAKEHYAKFVSLEGERFDNESEFTGGLVPVEWINSTAAKNFVLQIPPDTLSPSTTYTITISKEFTDKNGEYGNKYQDYILVFTTKEEFIDPNAIIPIFSNIPVKNFVGFDTSDSVQIAFDEPINPNSIIGTTQIDFYRDFIPQSGTSGQNNPVSFTLSWNDSYTLLTVTPVKALEGGVVHTLKIRSGLQTVSGKNVKASEISFTTYAFTIESVSSNPYINNSGSYNTVFTVKNNAPALSGTGTRDLFSTIVIRGGEGATLETGGVELGRYDFTETGILANTIKEISKDVAISSNVDSSNIYIDLYIWNNVSHSFYYANPIHWMVNVVTPIEIFLPPSALVTVGLTTKLTVTGDDIPDDLVWESTNDSIVTVDNTGTVKGIAVGNTTIHVYSENNPSIEANCEVYVTIKVYDASQGLSNQQLWLLVDDSAANIIRKDIQVIQNGILPATPYINRILTPYDATGQIYFYFTMQAGINSFDDVRAKSQTMPQIHIYDETGTTKLASYEEGSGLLKYYPFKNRTLTIGVNAGVLPAGTYMIVFGSAIAGNSADRTLGVDIKFYFEVVGEPPVADSVTGVNASISSAIVTVGESFQIEAQVAPESAANKNVIWKSSNESVVKVVNGLVTTLGAGSATITVETVDGGYTATCDVTVKASGPYQGGTQGNLSNTITVTPSASVAFKRETLDAIYNEITFNSPFLPKNSVLNLTLTWGGGTSGGQLTAAGFKADSMPHIRIVDETGVVIADYNNGEGLMKFREGQGWTFGVDAGVLEEFTSYIFIVGSGVGTRNDRTIGKDIRFKFTTGGVLPTGSPQVLSFRTASVSVAYGSTPAANNTTVTHTTGGGVIIYTSSDPLVASVNSETGAITTYKIGTTQITATAQEVSGVWLEGTASYSLTVTPRTTNPYATLPVVQGIKVGSGLSAIVAPQYGIGYNDEIVTGTLTWHTGSANGPGAQDSDLSSLTVYESITLYYRFVATDPNYSTTARTGSVTFTAIPLDDNSQPQYIRFASTSASRFEYGTSGSRIPVREVGEGDIVYTSSDPSIAVIDRQTGQFVGVDIGTVTITATALAVPGVWLETNATFELQIQQRWITVTKGTYRVDKVYDGTTDASVGTVTGELQLNSGDILPNDVDNISITFIPRVFGRAIVGEYNQTANNVTSVIVDIVLSGSATYKYRANNASSIVNVPGTISPANFEYDVPNQDINEGKGLYAIIAPLTGMGITVSGVVQEVTGELSWYIDSTHSQIAKNSDLSELTEGSTLTLYWEFIPFASNTNYVSSPKTGSTLFTITEGVQQNQTISFSSPTYTSSYYNTDPTCVATLSVGGGSISYASSDESIATIDNLGNVTIVKPGTVTITATASEVHGKWFEASTACTYTIQKGIISVEAGSYTITKIYDGTSNVGTVSGTFTVTGVHSRDDILGITVEASPRGYSGTDVNGYSIIVDITIIGDTDGKYDLNNNTILVPAYITKANQNTLTITGLSNEYTYGDSPISLGITGGTTSGSVTYISTNNSVATVNGSIVSIVGAGSFSIKATMAGGQNYNDVYIISDEVVVNKANQNDLYIIGLFSSYNYGEKPFAIGSIGGSTDGTTVFTSSDNNVATVHNGVVSIVGVGEFTITATKPENTNYKQISVTSKQIVVYPSVINDVKLTVTAPERGYKPSNIVEIVEGAGFTASPAVWSGGDLIEFEGATEYTATITLTVRSNYTFSGGLTGVVTINGMKATIINNGNTVLVIYQFPATEAFTIPDAPTNVKVTAGNAEATLTWSAPKYDGGKEILGYEVSFDNGVTWITASSSNSHTFLGLTNGKAYTFRVRAVNAIGESVMSSVVAAMPKAPNTSGTGGTQSIGERSGLVDDFDIDGLPEGSDELNLDLPGGTTEDGLSQKEVQISDEITPTTEAPSLIEPGLGGIVGEQTGGNGNIGVYLVIFGSGLAVGILSMTFITKKKDKKAV